MFGSIYRIPVQVSRKTSRQRYFPVFYRSNAVQEQEDWHQTYLARQIISVRAVISRLRFRSGKRKYVFHISAEITAILSKLLDFIFYMERMWKESYAIICMSRIISFPLYRFFHGRYSFMRFTGKKPEKRFAHPAITQFMRWMELFKCKKRGRICCVVGTSGSGKSTLLCTCWAGLDRPTSEHGHGGLDRIFSS